MTVQIVPGDAAEAAVWGVAMEVSRLFADVPWVLIGAQMVMLLEREAGQSSGRTTGDVDVVIDVRVLVGGTRAAAERLVAAGFEPSAEHSHRFARGLSQIDLLVPDHLGKHIDLTTIPPATTTEIPGGSRALATTRLVDVDVVSVGAGTLPVPSLAGAIVLKVRAWQARQTPRDAEDLVRLLGLVKDVELVRSELKRAERDDLARVSALGDASNRVWRAVVNPDDAQAAFARMTH